MRRTYHSLRSFESVSTEPTRLTKGPTLNMKEGDRLFIKIEEDLTVHKGQPVPVRAVVWRGKWKGAVLLGKASLENSSERILVDFHSISPSQIPYSYQFKGVLQDSTGQQGFKGNYNTNLWSNLFLHSATDSFRYNQKQEIRAGLRAVKRYLNQQKITESINIKDPVYGKILILKSPFQADKSNSEDKTKGPGE